MREMKDSGVEWIGAIPDNWEAIQLGYLCDDFIVPMRDKPKKFGGNIPWCRIEDIEGMYINDSLSGQYVDENTISELNLKIYPVGTVISSCSATIGVNAITTQLLCTNQTFIGIVAGKKLYNLFLFYIMEAVGDYLKFNGHGSTITYIAQEKYRKIRIPYCSLEEQKIIADKLNSKCMQIDSIISKQEAIIEKLKEYKLSVITEAVTKGLNPDVEMKDSDVEWVGRAPKDWKKFKLKNCSYIRARLGWKGLKAEEYVEEGFPLLSAFNIVNSKIDFQNNVNYINQERYDESPEIKLREGDILLVKDGAGIGKCGIIEELPMPSTTNGSLAVITTEKEVEPKFLYYYFLCSVFQCYIDRIKDGMGVPHLFQSDLKEISILVPSKDEQRTIIDYLDGIIFDLDNRVEKVSAIIDKLHEYKKSIIYEVITGKREV